MPSTNKILLTIAVMALVTYLCRMLPMVIFRKKISNVYVRSFLIYLPYGVLAAMVFPALFFSTGKDGVVTIANVIAATIGALIAVILSYKKKGLALVAIVSTTVVLLLNLLLDFLVKYLPALNQALTWL